MRALRDFNTPKIVAADEIIFFGECRVFCVFLFFLCLFALFIDLLTDQVLLSRIAAGSVPRCEPPPKHGHQDGGSHSTSLYVNSLLYMLVVLVM